ncbi:2-hydroxyacid dehydrogenase [Spirochaeta cellobiosiphila]|uniref:2-hydroxyacid dehydrogenase n=1 Tax=Spirochaeta cellobiosiphila TaxID=504483 RepID=UPI0004145CDB|nr:NAD(P)-dependent oxidoreductase [Spirochaeta cellobiosiphila]
MKILIMTSEDRVRKYYDLTTLPKDFELIFKDITDPIDEILSTAREAQALFADSIAQVPAKLIQGLNKLKIIHAEGVGYNGIDGEAAAKQGVYLCNNAGVNAKAVAEQTILLILALQRRLKEGDHLVKNGQQIQTKGRFIMEGIPELGDSVVGLIGFGAIARKTALLLKAFGCSILCYSRHKPEDLDHYGAEYKELDELLQESDIVSLHLPANKTTNQMVNKDFLYKMKKGALLINTARGELVQQEDLCEALIEGHIGGAGLDTLAPEPVQDDNPLLNLGEAFDYKLLLSPHIGGTTTSVFKRAHQGVWSNIIRVQKGQRPLNIVNGL